MYGDFTVKKLQKSAARAGRYTAKRELEKHTENFIGYTQEEYDEVGFLASIVPAVVSGFNAKYAPAFGMFAMICSLIITPVVSMYTPKYSKDFIEGIFN